MHWKTADQVHRRIGWMQSFGLLERWSSSKVVVTQLGQQFLSMVDLASPAEAAHVPQESEEDTSELPEPADFVAEMLRSLDDDKLSSRRAIIGYIPRGKKDSARSKPETQLGVVESVRKFVDLIGKGSSFDEIFGRASKVLNLKKTSFTQGMNTFRNMGVIDHTSFNRFAITPEGEALLSFGEEVDLVRFLHVRYRFVGELLAALRDTTPVSALVEISVGTYGCTQIDATEVRTRLNFLTDAGLVERIDWTRYRATARGLTLAGELPMEPIPQFSGATMTSPEDLALEVPNILAHSLTIVDIVADLRRHSHVSDASTEFEESVARAFQFLGFGAEHLGGSGQTDVLLTAELAPGDRYRSIVDAKASASGVIGDNAIKFDALKDHLRKHGADFGIVVGPDFVGRVKEWAALNGFTLLTVDELIGLLERHQRSPLSLTALRELFTHPESDLTSVDELYDQAADRAELLWKLVDILYREANEEDPVAGGSISLENLHYILRKDMASRPTRNVIEECLSFLSSGLVLAVAKSGDKYRIVDSPSNIGRRLGAFGVGLVNISSDVSGLT
jgi:hypothetical protein